MTRSISDAHEGLEQAISAVLLGTAWQRWRVHFLRDVLADVPKGSAETVAAALRAIIAQLGVFPNPDVLRRLAGAVLVEVHDEWQGRNRRHLSEGSMALLAAAVTSDKEVVASTELIPA